MKKTTCVYLNEEDIENAFKKKGFDVAVDADMGVLHVFCSGNKAMREKFDNECYDIEAVISEYIGEDVFSIVTRDGDQWFPADFIAFLK